LDTLRKLLDTEKPFIQKPKEKPIDQQISDLVRQGINLGMKLAKQNSTQTAGMRAADEGNEDGDEVEVLSPRFLSISERDANEKVEDILGKKNFFVKICISRHCSPRRCSASTTRGRALKGS
jgi:hypothetical protein